MRAPSSDTRPQGYPSWPEAKQVFRIQRRRVPRRTAELEEETVSGVTSLGAERADAGAVLQMAREHWHSENRSHPVREVSLDADRSRVRVGSIPEVMAALRNLTSGVLRDAGATNLVAAGRYYAAKPVEALALLGVEVKTK